MSRWDGRFARVTFRAVATGLVVEGKHLTARPATNVAGQAAQRANSAAFRSSCRLRASCTKVSQEARDRAGMVPRGRAAWPRAQPRVMTLQSCRPRFVAWRSPVRGPDAPQWGLSHDRTRTWLRLRPGAAFRAATTLGFRWLRRRPARPKASLLPLASRSPRPGSFRIPRRALCIRQTPAASTGAQALTLLCRHCSRPTRSAPSSRGHGLARRTERRLSRSTESRIPGRQPRRSVPGGLFVPLGVPAQPAGGA